MGQESAWKARDSGLIPGSVRSLGEGNSNPLLYSCLENSMDRGAWQATVHGVTRVRHLVGHKSLSMKQNYELREQTRGCQWKGDWALDLVTTPQISMGTHLTQSILYALLKAYIFRQTKSVGLYFQILPVGE